MFFASSPMEWQGGTWRSMLALGGVLRGGRLRPSAAMASAAAAIIVFIIPLSPFALARRQPFKRAGRVACQRLKIAVPAVSQCQAVAFAL